MNTRPELGGRHAALSDRDWVWPEAVGQGTFCYPFSFGAGKRPVPNVIGDGGAHHPDCSE